MVSENVSWFPACLGTMGTLVKNADFWAKCQAYSFTVSRRTLVFITSENYSIAWLGRFEGMRVLYLGLNVSSPASTRSFPLGDMLV